MTETALSTSSTQTRARTAGSRKAIVAGAAGNFVEFFDWTIYAAMAPFFASQFFPQSNPLVSLLLTFMTFALGYFARPLGALLIGWYGDRRGRRAALALTIVGTGLGSLIVGLSPTYATIGVAAPILLVLARLIQGVAAGGEGGAAMTFLTEHAKPGKRGLTGSWQQFSTGLSTLSALGVAALIGSLMSQDALIEWGWRIPFLVGAVLAVVGLYVRRRVEETEPFKRLAEQGPTPEQEKDSGLARKSTLIVRAIGITLFPSVAYMLWQVYLPAWASSATGMPVSEAQRATIPGLVLFVIMVPLMAMLSDRFGRKPLLLGFTGASVILAYPTVMLMHNSFGYLLAISLLGNIVLASMAGTITATLAEQFPTSMRATGVGLSYAIGVAIFGGTFPTVATWALSTGSSSWIFVYVVVLALVSGIAYLTMPEGKNKAF